MNKQIVAQIFFFLFFTTQFFSQNIANAAEQRSIKVGYIGSLSGFAATYGTAVLRGVELGIDELKSKNINLQLYIEDDASANKQTVTAYHYLVDVKKVDVIIAGTWWINDVISLSKRDNIPILSCETMFNDDAVLSSNYYLLGGDLRDWINTYSDLVKEKDFKRAAVIHFISGFGFTIKREVQNLFSGNGKKFLGSIEYTDPNVEDVNTIVLKLKQIKPEVVYIDGQPNGLAKILKKMKEMKIENITVFTNSIAEDMLKQNLISRESLPKLYFTKRASYSTEFINKFQSKYGIEPFLNADLGYYSTQIIAESLITTAKQGSFDIKNNLNIDALTFKFDSNNVFRGISQRIITIRK